MGARGENILCLFAEQCSAERQTARESLCGRYDVGEYAVVHVAVELAASAVACLNLVADEQNVALAADFFERLEIVFVERHNAALALNDFEHDRGAAIFKENFFNLLDIIWLNIDKSLSQRQKILVEHILPRCGEGGYRPAVEAVS